MKTYAIVAAILAVVTLLVYSYRQVYHLGRTETQAKFDHLLIQHRQRESKLLLSLHKAREKRRVVYRDRSKSFVLPAPAVLIGLCLTLSLASCANPTAVVPIRC